MREIKFLLCILGYGVFFVLWKKNICIIIIDGLIVVKIIFIWMFIIENMFIFVFIFLVNMNRKYRYIKSYLYIFV